MGTKIKGSRARKGTDERVPLVGAFYEDASKNLNAQRSVNWYPVGTLDGKTSVALFPVPGFAMQYAANLSNANTQLKAPLKYSPALDQFVCFGSRDDANNLGSLKTFPQNMTDDSTITTYSNFGGSNIHYNTLIPHRNDIFVTDRMALAVSGDTNTTRTNFIFALDYSNTANVRAGKIMWEDPIIPSSIAYMKGYAVINHDTGTFYNVDDPRRGRFYSNAVTPDSIGNVAIYDYDYSQMAYNTGEYVKAVVTNGQYLYVFGETHYEVWYFSGNADFPWDVIQEATGQVGLFAKTGQVEFKGSIYFVGNARNGQVGCYVINGLELRKISTPQIDRKIQAVTMNEYNYNRHPIVMVQEFNGHEFIYVVIYDGATGNRAYVYNITTGVWHEEVDYGRPAVAENYPYYEDFLTRSITSVYGVSRPFGIREGSLIKYNVNSPTEHIFNEDGSNQVVPRNRYRVTQHISGEDHYLFHHRFRLDVEANSNISYDANVNADIYLYSSDDDGKTWVSQGMHSISNVAYGKISGDKRWEQFRLGRSDDRIYKIVTNANTQVYLSGGFVSVERGYR